MWLVTPMASSRAPRIVRPVSSTRRVKCAFPRSRHPIFRGARAEYVQFCSLHNLSGISLGISTWLPNFRISMSWWKPIQNWPRTQKHTHIIIYIKHSIPISSISTTWHLSLPTPCSSWGSTASEGLAMSGGSCSASTFTFFAEPRDCLRMVKIR